MVIVVVLVLTPHPHGLVVVVGEGRGLRGDWWRQVTPLMAREVGWMMRGVGRPPDHVGGGVYHGRSGGQRGDLPVGMDHAGSRH